MHPIYTIGHSTRSLEELLRILERVSADTVVDVRRWPRSRRAPWFSRESLEKALGERGIRYVWLGRELGGYRRLSEVPEGTPLPRCYRSKGFQVYAAYILTSPAARSALRIIECEAGEHRVVILCSERLPWRCHRKIISEVLAQRGYKVVHIIDEHHSFEHKASECMKEYMKRVLGALDSG